MTKKKPKKTTTEKKYEAVLEIKYKLSGDFIATADHLLRVLMLCAHINMAYFTLVLDCRYGPQKSMCECSLTYLL